MKRLLDLELQKLLLNKTSKILIFISFILPLCVILLSAVKINFFGFFTLELGELGIFNFPIIWHITTFFSALFKFFFAIVVVSMIGNEYSNKTLKQNLIDGLSKKEFILSKFYVIVFFSLISTVIIFIISLILGLIYSSYNEFSIIIQANGVFSCLFCKTCRILFFLFIFGRLGKTVGIRISIFVCRFNFRMDYFRLFTWKSSYEDCSKSTRLFAINFYVEPYKTTFSACCDDKISIEHRYKL